MKFLSIFLICILAISLVGLYNFNYAFAALPPACVGCVSVGIPSGTSVPGCEERNRCFNPATVTIDVGGTVTWSNDDTAAHTVTSGNGADGPGGVFDSSLIMAGATFSHTFDRAGTFDYFCMVHPWMIGTVIVTTPYVSSITVNIDRSFYKDGDTIKISGNVRTLSESPHNTPVSVIITGPTGNIVSISQPTLNSNGYYSHSILAGGSMQVSGIYEVTAQYGTQKTSSTFSFKASVYVPPPPPEPEPTPAPEPTPEHELEHEPVPTTPPPTPIPAPSHVSTSSVKVADGSSVPGCEESYECYIPILVKVRPGTPLYWTNFDSAAHTVTSGTPADGPDGIFDSSLFKSAERFEVTLNNPGTYPYFCMVHPWMIGEVLVSGVPVTSTPTPTSAGITVDSSVPSQNDDLSELIGENKKLSDELERQGEQIDELNQEVDLLKQIIQSIQGFFRSIFG